MSELDYQRGLRGGDWNGTSRESRKDWQDGYDEYLRRLEQKREQEEEERRQEWKRKRENDRKLEEEDEERRRRYIETLPPEYRLKWYEAEAAEADERIRKREARELEEKIHKEEEARRWREEAPQRDQKNLITSIGYAILFGVIGFFVGNIAALIVYWIIHFISGAFPNGEKIFLVIGSLLGAGLAGLFGYTLNRERIQ